MSTVLSTICAEVERMVLVFVCTLVLACSKYKGQGRTGQICGGLNVSESE